MTWSNCHQVFFTLLRVSFSHPETQDNGWFRVFSTGALLALSCNAWSAPAGLSHQSFSTDATKPPRILNTTHLPVRVDNSPALLAGPLKVQGPYKIIYQGSIPATSGNLYAFLMHENLYVGKSYPVMSDRSLVFVRDARGNEYYCSTTVLRLKKDTQCGTFRHDNAPSPASVATQLFASRSKSNQTVSKSFPAGKPEIWRDESMCGQADLTLSTQARCIFLTRPE